MKTSLRSRLFLFGFIVIVAVVTSSNVIAIPRSKIVGATFTSAKIYANVLTGLSVKKVEMLGDAPISGKFLIGENGSSLLYESRGAAKGGYENESAAVRHYRLDGKSFVLLDEPLNLDRIREYRSPKGRTAYVVSMSDGGAGIPYVYVCSTVGKVWMKRATRVAGARNGKLILKRYVDGEQAGYEDAQPIGTMYLDLDVLLSAEN